MKIMVIKRYYRLFIVLIFLGLSFILGSILFFLNYQKSNFFRNPRQGFEPVILSLQGVIEILIKTRFLPEFLKIL